MAKFMGTLTISYYYNYMRILPIAKNSQNFSNVKTRNVICLLTTRVQEQQNKVQENDLKQNNIEKTNEHETTRSVHKIIDPTVHNYFAKEDSPLKMIGVHNMIDDAGLIEGEPESVEHNPEVDLKSGILMCGSDATDPRLVKICSVAQREESMKKEILAYVSSVRYIPSGGSRPAVMPALDSPYDEFPSNSDLEEPYDTDDEDNSLPYIEEP